ncbi:hypothetical protein Tco_1315738 [Tanacetum coccineum]
MSSPNHFTSDIEDAFSSMNILNYTSVSSDYFPVSLGSNSFNSSENSNDNMIPPVFSSFYNNTYLKDVQAIYAKEFPISSPDPITPSAILTLFLVLPPSLLFNPRYFSIPEELLPPKKRIHSPSSSSTTRSIVLIRCFERTDVMCFSSKYAYGTLLLVTLNDDCLVLGGMHLPNLDGIEKANQITWTELKGS